MTRRVVLFLACFVSCFTAGALSEPLHGQRIKVWQPPSSSTSTSPREAARSEEDGTILVSGMLPRPFVAASNDSQTISYNGICTYIDSVSAIRGLTRCPADLKVTTSFGRWIYFLCQNPPNCTISKPNCQVRLTVRAIQLDGGHSHSSTRPAGAPFDTTGNTGFDGDQFRIPHRWPQVGGPLQIRFWALHDTCGSTDSSNVDYVYCLAAAPLVPAFPCPPCTPSQFNIPAVAFPVMAASANYDLIGNPPGSIHPGNHYGLRAMIDSLASAAAAFRAKFPTGPKLAFNDMSLLYGGVFDLNANWLSPGHCGHRAGMECDFRTFHLGSTPILPPSSKYLAEAHRLLRARHFTIHPEKKPPHWHLKYYGPGTYRGPGSTLTNQPVVN